MVEIRNQCISLKDNNLIRYFGFIDLKDAKFEGLLVLVERSYEALWEMTDFRDPRAGGVTTNLRREGPKIIA